MNSKSIDILYVEDNDINFMLITELCNKYGDEIIVRHAKNIKEAYASIKKNPPNMILLDINLDNENDGIKLYKYVIKREIVYKENIIVITSKTSNEMKELIKHYGIVHCLHKPISIEGFTILFSVLVANLKSK